MNRASFGLVALLALITWSNSQFARAAPVKPQPTPVRFERGWQKSELYFGLSRPHGGAVSAREWQRFLAQVVTPRFPDGLTILDGAGQWRSGSGPIVREPSKILILLHPKTAQNERNIASLIEVYKKRFGQSSVLWVRSPVEVRF